MSSLSDIKVATNEADLTENTRFRVYTQNRLDQIEPLQKLSPEVRFEMEVVASVLPFRVNDYVINELIDWDKVPEDPVFQLTFPQKGMLENKDYERMADLIKSGAGRKEIAELAKEIREGLNPHPAGQQELNVPVFEDESLEGMQHKYRETVLFFPSQGQVCHAYCTFCFRWAQFVGDRDLVFASDEADTLHSYLRNHKEVSDLLLTGGDPMVMRTRYLKNYLEPLLEPEYDHIQTIRIGSKALTFWPQRFVTDNDAEEVLALFKKLVDAGKHVAFMAHFNHWQEMQPAIAREAIKRIRATGAVIRCQAPLVKNINDDPKVWERMWREQVKLGMIPYYMFVERNTGAKHYFEVPLVKTYEIYREAMKKVSGVARTVRGPSMSAGPGKVEIQGIMEVNGEKVFILRFIQGRNPDWVQKPFFAKYDTEATWFDDLVPAFGEEKFFFTDEYVAMTQSKSDEVIY